MPKQKTHKGIAKRVKVTAKGKIKFRRAGAGHLMSGKNAKRRQRISKPGTLTGIFARKIKRALEQGS